MEKPSIEKIKAVFSRKNYQLKKDSYELNIIGIRNDNSKPNNFDDLICVLFKDEYGDETLLSFSCTTDPGTFWLKHPLNIKGCAIMKEGHYLNVYKIGLHKGYKALEQVGKIRFVRDNDKDEELDFNGKEEIFEVIKANIHHAAMPENSTKVDKWSAGCQVINKGWEEFLKLCEKSQNLTKQKYFSYTLLNQRDFK